jgi:hypothetical protein
MTDKELKQPTYSISASLPRLSKVYGSAEECVTAWVKKNRRGKHSGLVNMVIENYDFYCLFVYLILEDVDKPYKKACQEWVTVA